MSFRWLGIRAPSLFLGSLALFIMWGLSAGCTSGQAAPSPIATPIPLASPAPVQEEVVRAAYEPFAQNCAPCHGQKGDRIAKARLDSKEFVDSLGEAGLTDAMAQGKGGMPAWSRTKGGSLSDEEIKHLVSYVMASAKQLPKPSPKPATPIPQPGSNASQASGLAGQGKELYERNCTSCHDKPEAIAQKATPGLVKSMGINLNEKQASAVFEYLRSAAAAAPSTNGQADPGSSAGPTATRAPQPPPVVPHRTEGRENRCLECHGLAGVKPYPIGHHGRTNDMCLLCHVKGPLPPAITHDLKGRESLCLDCHAIGGIIPPPADHVKRKAETCVGCHDTVAPGGSGVIRAPVVPHLVQPGPVFCFECHAGSRSMGPAVPDNHRGVGQEACLLCHITRTPIR